jgi:hypothetical protein
VHQTSPKPDDPIRLGPDKSTYAISVAAVTIPTLRTLCTSTRRHNHDHSFTPQSCASIKPDTRRRKAMGEKIYSIACRPRRGSDITNSMPILKLCS